MVSVEATRFQLQPVSATFHGRDIMAPAAAHLTQGVAPDTTRPAPWTRWSNSTGQPLNTCWRIAWDRIDLRSLRQLDHQYLRDMLPLDIPTRGTCQIGDHYCQALVDTYGQARPHTLVALFGSNDRLEIAVTNGSADEVVQGGRDRAYTSLGRYPLPNPTHSHNAWNLMFDKLRYLLFQVRNHDDPICSQEIDCFARALQCERDQISIFNILQGVPTRQELNAIDMVLTGGSGDYSVAAGGSWLPAALETMRELHDWSKPTFASCWGFQAMALALGGEVVTDLSEPSWERPRLYLTEAGQRDPVFGPCHSPFVAHIGTSGYR